MIQEIADIAMQTLPIRSLAVTLICALSVPQQGLGDSRSTAISDSQPVLKNVELAAGGIARGKAVDPSGRPVQQPITLQAGKAVYRVTPDEHGEFSVPGLTGGACLVKAGETTYGCRLWKHGTAPPGSLQAFIVVDQSVAVVRGQEDCVGDACDGSITGEPGGFGVLNPLSSLTPQQMVGLGLLAAGATVAIVLAAQDDGDASY